MEKMMLSVSRMIPLTEEEREEKNKNNDYRLNNQELMNVKRQDALTVEITEKQWEAIRKEVLKTF